MMIWYILFHIIDLLCQTICMKTSDGRILLLLSKHWLYIIHTYMYIYRRVKSKELNPSQSYNQQSFCIYFTSYMWSPIWKPMTIYGMLIRAWHMENLNLSTDYRNWCLYRYPVLYRINLKYFQNSN